MKEIQKIKKTQKPWIIIILGLIALLGIGGTIVYFATKDKTTTQKSSETPQQTIQNLQTQLNQIEQILNKPENLNKISLKTNLGVIKGKITKLIQENNHKSEDIKKLEREIKQIQQELNIPPINPKPDNPPEAPKPPPNNPPNPDDNPSPPQPDPSPKPNNPPDQKWEDKKATLIDAAKNELVEACKDASLVYHWVTETDWVKNWNDELEKVSNENEFNDVKKLALKDIAEIKMIIFQNEREKLKDYYVFNLGKEIILRWVDNNINVRDLVSLSRSLSKAIKGNPNSSWERKYIAFTGDFNINNKDDGKKFDDWVKVGKDILIVIKKDHNPSQYSTERNTFFLKKGLPDYHEFKTYKEALDFLRANDSYFN